MRNLKWLKKSTALLLTIALAGSLAACGSKADEAPAAEPTTPLVFHTMQSQLKGKSLKQLPTLGLAVVSKAVFLHLGNSTRTVPGQIPALIPDPAGRVRQHRVWQCCPSAAFSA